MAEPATPAKYANSKIAGPRINRDDGEPQGSQRTTAGVGLPECGFHPVAGCRHTRGVGSSRASCRVQLRFCAPYPAGGVQKRSALPPWQERPSRLRNVPGRKAGGWLTQSIQPRERRCAVGLVLRSVTCRWSSILVLGVQVIGRRYSVVLNREMAADTRETGTLIERSNRENRRYLHAAVLIQRSAGGRAQQVTCRIALVSRRFCLQYLDSFARRKHQQFDLAATGFALDLIHHRQRTSAGTDHKPAAFPRYILFDR